jgi:hypothetical protein
LPGDHRKVYANRSEADFVMPSGIITSYLDLRLVVAIDGGVETLSTTEPIDFRVASCPALL